MQPPPYSPQQPPQQPAYPPYYGPPPVPPKRGMSGWAIAGLVAGVGCLALVFGIAILSAILFPVFAQAREKARAAACLANLRQVSNVMQMYSQDYDGYLPAAGRWVDLTVPYAGSNDSSYHCPSLRGAASGGDPNRYGYAMDSRRSSANLLKVPAPASLPLVYDSTNERRNAADPGTSRAPRHNNGANIVYADGHAKWERQKQTSGG